MKTRGRPRHPDVLTPREWEVLTLVREGLTNPQIAERMGITMDAAKYHVSEILSKLQLRSREEAAAWQPEPSRVPVLRPSWANALGGWWPLIARVAGAGVVVAAVAGLAVLAYGVMMSEGEDEPSVEAAPSAAATPSPILGLGRISAEQIIADGRLTSYAVTESGTMLTVWGTCTFVNETGCGLAWRLGTGSQPQATGVIGSGAGYGGAYASGDGFVLTPPRPGADLGLRTAHGFRIAQDGTASPLSMACTDASWSTPTEPGRLVWAQGLILDTVAGTICDPGQLGGRPLDGVGAITAEGTLWALLDNPNVSDTLTIGRFDGAEWRYHDFAAQAGSGTSLLAAAGSTVVVLQANPEPLYEEDQLVGFAVTTDDGETWSEVLDPDVLERDLPFSLSPNLGNCLCEYPTMAFAGTSALYIADVDGALWRSTDFATFSRVSIPGGVRDVTSVGDAVIARIDTAGTCDAPAACQLNDLVRISADGSVEPITVR